MDASYIIAFLVIAVGGWVAYAHRANREYLPGPPRLPLIGSAHHIPKSNPWLTFSEWNTTYGGMLQLDAAGKSIVVINSLKIAKDLLEKRSSIYSDRPQMTMAGDLVGISTSFSLMPYGDAWRKQRRIAGHDFSPNMVPQYHALQEKEVATLVKNVLENPKRLRDEVQFRIGIIIMRATYGYYVKSPNDHFLQMGLTGIEIFSQTTIPGKYLVDMIPALRYLPLWMPGAGFLKDAAEYRALIHRVAHEPYDWCKANLDTGKTLMPNVCGSIIQEEGEQLSDELEHNIIWASVSMLGGGLDTTSSQNTSAALSFIMAMILHPEVQKKAQAELDAVIGTERLPVISDRPNLPYIRSVMAETLRWAPPAPLGVAHAVSEDDVYEGRYIPKGSVVLPNIWHMLHDPEVYPNPMEFNPDRFAGDEVAMTNTQELAFGFGRRVCPGMHFAQGTLFAIVATFLATCNILPGLDEEGREVMPVYKYSTGTIVMPEVFSLRLRARSKQAVGLLAEASAVFPE